jgi:hypothetical protein
MNQSTPMPDTGTYHQITHPCQISHTWEIDVSTSGFTHYCKFCGLKIPHTTH